MTSVSELSLSPSSNATIFPSTSSGPNVVDVFAQGPYNAGSHLSCTRNPRLCKTTQFTAPGITGSPTAVSWGPGRLDAFVAGYLSEFQHYWRTPGQPWRSDVCYCGHQVACPHAGGSGYSNPSGYLTR